MWYLVLAAALHLTYSAGTPEYRLPGDVVPAHYDLRLTYDIDPGTNFSFFGAVEILLSVKKPTSKVVLHAQDFTVSSEDVSLSGPWGVTKVTGIGLIDAYNLLTITLDEPLETATNYTLTIPFYGNLDMRLDGAYISTYVNKKTKQNEYLIVTKFEPISARKAFPCFDEPMFKATLSITLGHHKEFTAISNMPLKTSSQQNAAEPFWSWTDMQQKFKKSQSDFVWDEFDKSVPMSTFLVAWVVSKFSHVDSPPALSTTKFRIWARSDAIDQTEYASTIGPRVLTYFESFFNVSFPLPKQDMIAIPDFSSGAMENWGLITYRESSLLYDKAQSSFLAKQTVAEIIAHELAHQWFGNLVTMKWWSDLWLNEGFAKFMESVGVAAVEPDWRVDRSHAVNNILSVLSLDALESSHPVSVPIDDPKRFSEIFDDISYKKGSSLIRMMTMFLGEDVFRKAIHNYLIKYSYQNAEQDDLWEELTRVSQQHGGLTRNVTVKEVMDTWTTQTGYPVLTVTRDYGDNTLTIDQKRYLALSSRSTTKSSWWVPLSVLCEPEAGSPSQPLQWLADDEGVTSKHRFKHGAKNKEWVLFNYDMIAPYRVNYDTRNWQLLSSALTGGEYSRVPVLGRVQLLADAFDLAWADRLDYDTCLQLATYLHRETEYLPLKTGLEALTRIENVLKRSPDYGAFQKYVRQLIEDTYRKTGGLAAKKIIDKDNLNSVNMQVLTSSWACRMQVPGCQENAIELFDRWMSTPNPDENNPTMWYLVLAAALHLTYSAGTPEYRLPGDVVPAHYDLRLTYDIDPGTNFSFFGAVVILLSAKKPTSKVVLHAQDFTVSSEHVSLSGPRGVTKVTGIALIDAFNLLTITLDEPLETATNYTLTIPFYGNLKMELQGAYISTYVNMKTMQKEYLTATHFEPLSARKAFPCFDEPMFKATFSITLGHHKEFTAISNMPLKTSSQQNAAEPFWSWTDMQQKFKKSQSDFVWDEFGVSVPMSTYLVAWVVSKFSHVDSPPALSTTKFRIWARSDAIDQTEYASTTGPRVLTYFESFFNVSFPLPKQDMIAIPDFSFGGMENWGLITYRESSLLYDKAQSSLLDKKTVAEVISHELAHQWFGNLVTMKWWSDLWLKEGFAQFMESFGVAAVEPDWRADRSFAVTNILTVLSVDALESSHPVSVPIDDPKRISEIFNDVSYKKGSSLIRMMTMFLGEDVFRKAIHNYLIKYSYQNAEQDDLWEELTRVSQQHGGLTRNVTVKEVMDTWTTQTGYPILTVTRDYGDNTLTIEQKRYLALSSRSTTKSSWWVPLSVLCEPEAGSPSQPLQWLADDEGVTSKHRFKHGAKNKEWVLFNYDMIAPYRVNYDTRNWQLLSSALTGGEYSRVPVLGRVQLLADAFDLAWTDRLDYDTCLQLATYLHRETEYLPLKTGLEALTRIENVLKRSPDYGAFQKYVRQLIEDTYRKTGGLTAKKIIDKDNLNSVNMQVLMSSWACRMQVPGCQENAIELFDRWMSTSNPDENNPIPLDLRRNVYEVAIACGGVRHWRFAFERQQRAKEISDRKSLLKALASTREPWILAEYLELCITEGSEVRRQDAGFVISFIIQSPVGFYVARDFIYNRIRELSNVFRGQPVYFGTLVLRTLLDQFTTQDQLDEFQVWREKNAKYLVDVKLALEQAVENAAVNIAWTERHRRHVVDRLRHIAASVGDERHKLARKLVHRSGAARQPPLLRSLYVFVFLIIICRL